MRALLLIALSFMLLPVAASATDEAGITPDEVIYFTNQKRVERGLTPLEVSPELSRAASAKARDMIESQYYAHAEWERFIRVAGYSYCLAGENLAMNYTDAGELVDAWMGSPDHRYNLLKAGYNEIGVAVVKGRYKTVEEATFVVQMFGARCR
ncbi:MAG TPA: CAP domain-containing protein [Pyrinomonadaceae bacterium]|jgi:uncharacterized protein YkwD